MTEERIRELVNRYIALQFSVTKKAEAMIKEKIGSDLTHDQHYMLRYIHQRKSCTSTALAEEFEVNKSAITAIINRLWDKGLIERTRDEKDRRVVYLTLTDKGREFFEKAEERVTKLVESFICDFEQSEIEKFIQTYEKLNQKIISQK